jgi:hypothetical protein
MKHAASSAALLHALHQLHERGERAIYKARYMRVLTEALSDKITELRHTPWPAQAGWAIVLRVPAPPATRRLLRLRAPRSTRSGRLEQNRTPARVAKRSA